jgi:hypothetical protein
MDILEKIKYLIKQYCSDKDEYITETNIFLDQGEYEYVFGAVIAKIKTDHAILTPTDKQLIDEIGEFLWNGNIYHRGCMRTKYWLELVDKPPYDNDNDPRRLIALRNSLSPKLVEYNRKNFVEIDKPQDWYRTELPLAEDTIQLLEGDSFGRYHELLNMIERDLPSTEFEVLV